MGVLGSGMRELGGWEMGMGGGEGVSGSIVENWRLDFRYGYIYIEMTFDQDEFHAPTCHSRSKA